MSRQINQNVVVTIKVNNVGQAQTQLQNMGSKGSSVFGSWLQAIRTVEKALISMVGVLTAWTLFVTIPEKLASAFKDLAFASVSSAAEMERSILSLAGLLSSFRDFGGKDITENFQLATKQAEKLQLTFAQMSAKSLGSAQDLLLVYQTLVSRGGLEFVKTQQEALDLTRLLTDTIITLTGGLQKERQLVSETDALFQGQARSGALLAKIIKAQVGDLKAWVQSHKTSKDLLQDMEKLFGGINAASGPLANTFEGIVNTIKGQLTAFNLFAQRVGVLQNVLNWLKGIRDELANALNDLNGLGEGSHKLSVNTEKVLELFGYFNAAMDQTLKMIQFIFVGLTGTGKPLDQANTLATNLATVMTEIRTVVETLVLGIRVLVEDFKVLWSVASGLAEVMGKIFVGDFVGAWEASKKNAIDVKNAVMAWTAEIEKQHNTPNFSDRLKQNMQEMQDQVKITVGGMKLMFKDLAGTTLDLGKSLRDNVTAPTKQQLDYIEKLEDANMKLYNETLGKQDIFGASVERSNEAIREMNEHLADQPALLKRAREAIFNIAVLSFNKDLSKWLEDYDKDRMKFVEEFNKHNADNILDENLLKIMKGLKDSGFRFFNDIADDAKIAVDASSELRAKFVDLQNALDHGGWDQFRSVLKDIPKLYQNMGTQITHNNTLIDELNRKKGISAEMDVKIEELTKQLVRENVALNVALTAQAEAIRQSLSQFESMSDIIQRIIIKMILMKDAYKGLKDILKSELPAILRSLGAAFSQFISDLVSGANAGIPIWKRLLASILNTLAAVATALGVMALAGAQIPIFGHLFGGYKAAIAMFAAAGVLSGLAARLGGGGGDNAKESQSSGSLSAAGTGDRQVIFQPTANFDAIKQLKDAAEALQKAHENLSGIPAGQIVAIGASTAKREITAAVTQQANSSASARVALRNTVMGEAG